MFKNLYDSIRIVDPINKKVINSSKGSVGIVKEDCYGICSNCISMKAYLQNDTFSKLEFIDGKIMLIISSPVNIENNIYIVELIKDISQKGNIMNNEQNSDNIENLIKEMNDTAINH